MGLQYMGGKGADSKSYYTLRVGVFSFPIKKVDM